MKYSIILLLISCLCFGCNSNNKSTQSDSVKNKSAKAESETKQEMDDVPDEQESAEAEEESSDLFIACDHVKKLLKEWNAAISANEPEKLGEMYADRVDYYLQNQTRKACVDQKASWLAAHPNYKQKITYQEIYFFQDDTTQNLLIAEFDKQCIDQGKTVTIPSFLYFSKFNGEWKIIKETDRATEANRVKKSNISTLKPGEYSFFRSYYKDTRDIPNFAHEVVPFWFGIDITVGKEITGEYDYYSGEMRSITYNLIPAGEIKNGILDLTVIDCSSLVEIITIEEYESGEYDNLPKSHMHFKILNGNELVCLDKDDYLYGKSMPKRIEE